MVHTNSNTTGSTSTLTSHTNSNTPSSTAASTVHINSNSTSSSVAAACSSNDATSTIISSNATTSNSVGSSSTNKEVWSVPNNEILSCLQEIWPRNRQFQTKALLQTDHTRQINRLKALQAGEIAKYHQGLRSF